MEKTALISVVKSDRAIVRGLLTILIALFLVHFAIVIAHFQFGKPLSMPTALFDVDVETNIPTFFNVMLFILGSICFYLVGRTEEKNKRGWNIMSLVFLFLAMDEGSKIHEKLMLTTLRLMNDGDLGLGQNGWLFYAWIIPYGIAALALVAGLLPWLLKLDRKLMIGLFVSGGVYVFGAIFLEAWSGKVAESILLTAQPDSFYDWLPCSVYKADNCFTYADIRYVLLYSAEEFAEMTGLILCIGVLTKTLKDRNAKIQMGFGE